MIGTPFEIKNDEIHNKRISKRDRKENEEYALNEKGQRRFHGAFTGGFNAGYNNTVGSEAGFTPAQFDRNKKYTVFDIMDEEDLGDHIQGQTIQTKEGYDTLGENHSEAVKNQLAQGALAAMIPDELIVAPKSSIGYKLLKKLGWDERSKRNLNFTMEDEGQSDDSIDFDKIEGLDISDFINESAVNGESSGKTDEVSQRKRDAKIKKKLQSSKTEKPIVIKKDYENFFKGNFKYKTDKYGIGYIPTSQDFMLEKKRQELLSGTDNNKITMGKLNYDDGVYQEDDKDNLEIMDEIGHEVQDKIKEKQMQNLFHTREEKNDFYSNGFLPKDFIEETKIKVPHDFDPNWRKRQGGVQLQGIDSTITLNKRKLDANKRAMILGEEIPEAALRQVQQKDIPSSKNDNQKANLQSRFSVGGELLPDKMGNKEEDNLQGTKHLLVDIPFKKDKEKVQRFK